MPDSCIICGAHVPEGRMVCWICDHGGSFVPPPPAKPVTDAFWTNPDGYKAVEAAVIAANRKKYYRK